MSVSWGPNGLGAIKPDIMAPSGYLSSEIPTGTTRRGCQRTLPAAAGYGIGGGTSQATPTMAGALALLIERGETEQVPYDADRIWRAVTKQRATRCHHCRRTTKGTVLSMSPALELLNGPMRRKPPVITIESRGPVRTLYSGWLARPNEGVGIWELEGWRRVTRRSHDFVPRNDRSARADDVCGLVADNDGTFFSPTSVTLARTRCRSR